MRKLSKGQLNCSETQLNFNVEDDEEMKVAEKAVRLTSFIDKRRMRMGSSNEPVWTRNEPVTEPTLHFDMVKNGMAGT